MKDRWSLTGYLDQFKTGGVGTVTCRIANAPGGQTIDQMAPEYEAAVTDLEEVQVELQETLKGKRPQPRSRFDRAYMGALCAAGVGTGLTALFGGSFLSDGVHAVLTTASSGFFVGALGFFAASMFILRVLVWRFGLETQLKLVNNLLEQGREAKATTVIWNDVNGEIESPLELLAKAGEANR